MLTVVHEGATVSTYVLVLITKTKKIHWVGRPYENPYVHKEYRHQQNSRDNFSP